MDTLPIELLYTITSYCFIPTLASLSKCSRHFRTVFLPLLYKHDVAGENLFLEISISRCRNSVDILNVFKSILKAGANLGKKVDLARVAPDFSIPTAFLRFDNDHKTNVMHIATYAGLIEVVEYLIKGRYVAFGPFTYGPLHYALQGRHIKTSKTLIQRGADLGDESKSALEVTASQGLTEIVVLLVEEKGMDPDGRGIGQNPLGCAMWSNGDGCKDDALATVTFLLERGANPDLPV